MKKTIQTLILIFAVFLVGIWLINIIQESLVYIFGSDHEVKRSILMTLVNYVPLILLSGLIALSVICEFTHKKLHHEKILYSVTIVAFIPKMFSYIYFGYISIKSIQSAGAYGVDIPKLILINSYARSIFYFLVSISILVFLISCVLDIRKIKKFNVVFFAICACVYLVLSALLILQSNAHIFTSDVVNFLFFISVGGFMFISDYDEPIALLTLS